VLARFKKSLEDAPIIKVGEYDYFVHPITDGVPARTRPSWTRWS
jgi:adenine phosphoribosyltransferase